MNYNFNGGDSLFNTIKYQALAYSTQPYGLKLAEAVEANWNDWLQTVKEARWLKLWLNYDKLHQDSCTPKGQLVDQKVDTVWLKGQKSIRVGNVALLVYTNAVWGWGIEDWLHNSLKQIGLGRPINRINRSVLDVRGGENFLEPHGGMLLPPEYVELDQWLEKLWDQVLIER